MLRSLRPSALTAIFATVVVLAACGPSPAPPASPSLTLAASTTPSCAARSDSAERDVLAVVEKSRACTVDADCVTVSVGARCFDVCSRAVSTSGAQAVRDAEAQVDRTTCATYKEDGCSFPVPPCSPPRTATCNAGLCQ